MKHQYYLFIPLLFIVGGLVGGTEANALAEEVRVRFDAPTISRGYTAEYHQTTHPQWGDFRVGILPDLVNEVIDLNIKQFDGSAYPDPEGMVRVSDYYIYDILRQDQENKDPLILNKPFHLAVRFDSGNLWRKRVMFWNKPSQSWVPLPSSADYDNGYIRAITHLPFSRIAVFEDQGGTEGYASWYRSSRYSYGAASNDFPMGTVLRVRNVDTGKVVDVTVQSTGPFTPFEQRRVIDLTYDAFQQIEEPWQGTVRVQAWVKDSGTVLGAETETHAASEPRLNSSAVIAMRRDTEEIIYSKNYDTVRPMASITKLMTAVVFLETGTPFDQEVTYAAEDAAIGAKLYVSPGEQMTVKDLWYTMLVGSANNAANALARASGLSRDEFVSRMNAKADAWGLYDTEFHDVSGLDVRNTSTVHDIARLAKHAFDYFEILQGSTTWSYGFRTINTNDPHTISTTAPGMRDYDRVITGMKTGYLDEAGYCFVLQSSTSRDAPEVITVILGAGSSNQRWDDTRAVTDYALNQL